MSHQTSRIVVMDPEATSVPMNASKSAQSSSAAGNPAVGSPSNTFDRLESRPVSTPSQYGLEPERARKCGM